MRRKTRFLAALAPAAFAFAISPTLAASLQVTSGAAFTGNYGLELSVGSSCTAPLDVDLSPGPVQSSVAACRTITATDVEIVGPGASFLAGRSVDLHLGFAVTSQPFDVTIDQSLYPLAFVRDDSPADEDDYQASFAIRLDNLNMGVGDVVEHLEGRAASGVEQFLVLIERNATDNVLRLEARQDDGSSVETPAGQEIMLPAGWNEISLDWQTGPGTGSFLLTLNGTQVGGLTGLDNANARIDLVDWGAVDGSVSSTSGSIEMDEFVSMRE